MKNRRDFLKSLLGVALVAPAVAACRTVVPAPIVLPAAVEPLTVIVQNRYRSQRITQAIHSTSHTPSIHRGCYVTGSYTGRLDYNRGPMKWVSNHVAVFPYRPVRPWFSARYWK